MLEQQLNTTKLAEEYLAWIKINGDGRDGEDQRFGQHICNRYGIDPPRLFFVEDATEAFSIAMAHIAPSI